jgi:hypothetical protein
MECVPTERIDVAKLALPELKVAVPNVAMPSRKVTLPVGVPEPGATALTVAVNVTNCRNTAGFTEETTTVEVLARFTVCVMAADVLALKLVSPT